MNDIATFRLVQWANGLKGEELQKLPEEVREAVIYEQERMEKHRVESKRDNDIIKRFPVDSTFEDQLGRQCKVWKHVIDRDGYGVDASITGVGMGYFHSSQLAEIEQRWSTHVTTTGNVKWTAAFEQIY